MRDVLSIESVNGPSLIIVAPCSTLRLLTTAAACADGDSFITRGPGAPHPGGRLALGGRITARVPPDARLVTVSPTPVFDPAAGLLVTPAVAARLHLGAGPLTAVVSVDPRAPLALDHVSDAVARVDLDAQVTEYTAAPLAGLAADLRHDLFAGAVVVLVVIGISLLLAAAEQLRERRRALSVLAAFGTRRSTLAWSVLLQTALPVALGLALAILLGTAVGAMLMRVASLPLSLDWGALGAMTGAGAAVVAGVTLLTLPVLWRMTRPDSLWGE